MEINEIFYFGRRKYLKGFRYLRRTLRYTRFKKEKFTPIFDGEIVWLIYMQEFEVVAGCNE